MKEHQHIEWKESRRDEYLKWICGFAKAEGGVLVIGRKDKGVPGKASGTRSGKGLDEKLDEKLDETRTTRIILTVRAGTD